MPSSLLPLLHAFLHSLLLLQCHFLWLVKYYLPCVLFCIPSCLVPCSFSFLPSWLVPCSFCTLSYLVPCCFLGILSCLLPCCLFFKFFLPGSFLLFFPSSMLPFPHVSCIIGFYFLCTLLLSSLHTFSLLKCYFSRMLSCLVPCYVVKFLGRVLQIFAWFLR